MRGYSIGNIETNDISVINKSAYEKGINHVFVQTTKNEKQKHDYRNKQNNKK